MSSGGQEIPFSRLISLYKVTYVKNTINDLFKTFNNYVQCNTTKFQNIVVSATQIKIKHKAQ